MNLSTQFLPLEVLIYAIFEKYLYSSYCISIVSEKSLNFNFTTSFTYLVPNDSLVQQVFDVSEKGCSDYIVQMADPKNFLIAYEKVNRLANVRRSDRKLIFLPFSDDPSRNYIMIDIFNYTKYITNVLVIVPSLTDGPDCTIFDLVTHQYIGLTDMNQPMYLDTWNFCTNKFSKDANLFPHHDLSNLYGKVVKVACFTYKPYVLLDLDTSIEPLGRDGFEMRIMDDFCRWFNCTVEIVRDDANEWGEIFENGTGIGILGNVVQDRADFGITALYSWYEEYRVLDFSAATIRTSITCLTPAPRLLASWEMPLLPFSWYMWLAILFTWVYASIAMCIAKRSTDRVLLTTFGIIITQPQYDDAGLTWRVRSITGWLLMTGLVIDNAYGGGLASTFTVPKYEKSIDTVQDIVDRNMNWGATHDAWIFSLMFSNEPLVKQLVSLFRVYPADELERRSYTRTMAFSIEKLPAGYFAIGEYITQDAALNSYLMLEDFYFEQCVVMMRKSSPYTEKVSQFVGRLHETGLLLAWETQVALKYLNYGVQLEVRLARSKRDVHTVESMSFRHVVGLFVIYGFGVSVSLLLFIIEVAYGRKLQIIAQITSLSNINIIKNY